MSISPLDFAVSFFEGNLRFSEVYNLTDEDVRKFAKIFDIHLAEDENFGVFVDKFIRQYSTFEAKLKLAACVGSLHWVKIFHNSFKPVPNPVIRVAIENGYPEVFAYLLKYVDVNSEGCTWIAPWAEQYGMAHIIQPTL